MTTEKIRTCPICGKVFATPDPEAWVYKRLRHHPYRTIWLCSWKCLRKEEADYETVRLQRREAWIKSVKRGWEKRKANKCKEETHEDTAKNPASRPTA